MARENFELRVGFFALGAIMLLLYGLAWLKSFSLFDPPQVFWVRFHDLAGLSNNATVNVQGVRVGTVSQISFKLPEGLKEPPDASAAEAKLPKVYAQMKVTGLKELPIPQNAEITIQTLGLVGAKYIEITLPPVGSAESPPMNKDVLVEGKDPVRVELVVNNIATKLNGIASSLSPEEAAAAVKHLSQAAEKLDKNLDSMPGVTASLRKASDNVGVMASKFGKTADKAERVADNANSFLTEGKTSFQSVTQLAHGVSTTNSKVSKILDNPALTKDLRETVELAHKTATSVQAAIADLNSSVKDKELRSDLLTMLGKIQNSSEQIRQSMQVVNKLADDQGLRSDVKDMMNNAKEAMTKANTMLTDPAFKADLTQTMTKVRTAATDVDVAAKQLHYILGKRAPLFQMMFMKPSAESKTRETLQDGTSVNNSGGYN